MGAESVLLHLSTILFLILGIVILKEKLYISKIISIALVVIASIIAASGCIKGNLSVLAVFLFVMQAIIYSTSSVYINVNNEKCNNVTYTAYTSILGGFASIVLGIVISPHILTILIHIGVPGFILIICMILMHAFVGIAYYYGITKMDASTFNLFGGLETITEVLLGIFFLKEELTTAIVVSVGIILLSLVLTYCLAQKERTWSSDIKLFKSKK